MCTLSLPCLFWSTVIIQIVGAATIVAIHQSAEGRGRVLCQRLFFALLTAMGLVTAVAVSGPSELWMASGATLSIMTVFATRDMGADRRRAVTF